MARSSRRFAATRTDRARRRCTRSCGLRGADGGVPPDDPWPSPPGSPSRAAVPHGGARRPEPLRPLAPPAGAAGCRRTSPRTRRAPRHRRLPRRRPPPSPRCSASVPTARRSPRTSSGVPSATSAPIRLPNASPSCRYAPVASSSREPGYVARAAAAAAITASIATWRRPGQRWCSTTHSAISVRRASGRSRNRRAWSAISTDPDHLSVELSVGAPARRVAAGRRRSAGPRATGGLHESIPARPATGTWRGCRACR